jgi:type IV pilus assembly protein PilF
MIRNLPISRTTQRTKSFASAKSWIQVLLLAVLLSACGTTSSKPKSDEPSEARKAAETNTSLGRQYIERRQYEIALEKLKRAVAYDKTYAPAHTLLGVLYETLGQVKEAGKEYKLAVEYDPDDGDVNNNYAAYLCNQAEGKRAEEYFQTAFRDPFYATPQVAYANAGICALGLNDLDKAERYLRQSLEYDAEFAAALLPMADLNYRKGTYLPARAFLQRFESVGQEGPSSLLLGYQIELALGNVTAADRYQKDLNDQFPTSAEAAQAREQ